MRHRGLWITVGMLALTTGYYWVALKRETRWHVESHADRVRLKVQVKDIYAELRALKGRLDRIDACEIGDDAAAERRSP